LIWWVHRRTRGWWNLSRRNWSGPKLDTGDVELLDEEACPSKKHLWKSKCLLERQEIRGWLDARVAEADSDANDFWYVNYFYYYNIMFLSYKIVY
jgi:hypothetical protein